MITETLNTPTRGGNPQGFSDSMDTLLSKLPNWTDQANELATNVNAKESSATSAASSAGTSAEAATTQAGIAAAKATQTMEDAVATAEDRVQTGLDRMAAASSAAAAIAAMGTMTPVEEQTHAADVKATPADEDEFSFVDSAASWVLKKFTWANLRAALKTSFDGIYSALSSANTFTKAQRGAFVTLTDAATIAIDLSLANQYNVTLGGNRTLGVPTNGAAGQQGIINIRQDGTGSRTLAYAWIWATAGGSFSALSTTACARDLLPYSVDSYATGNPTLTIATPCVVTLANHGLQSGDKCQLTTTGALPTGLAASTTYYVHVIDVNTLHLCTSLANVAAGTYIATSGSQSGVHSIVAGVISVALAKGVA